MIGQTISHFRILDQLGQGGMGVVYRAQDLRLDREVALKFLAPNTTASPDARQRFLQEARVASALDHPNVCTIFEIDEMDDHAMFIAMAYYRGETLARKIRCAQFAWHETIDLIEQIARGLEAAHRAKLMHRDIKPANIMVTAEGLVKILDFGLARLVGESNLTQEGTRLGTVAYMSPEQAQGQQVDQRTDLWSLGIVLYELITGQQPFRGEDLRSTLCAIISAEAPPLSSVRSDVPLLLQRIIDRALAKRPEQRYQDTASFLEDLQRIRWQLGQGDSRGSLDDLTVDMIVPPPGTSSSQRELSILVMPFADLSPENDNEYFSDGLSDEIIADLSQIHGLRVISRTSAMLLKNAKKDVRTIGRELGVDHVLEGSVRKAGNKLRITSQLIDAMNDQLLWTQRFSGTLDDIFEIQEKVSQGIVTALKVKLTPQEELRIHHRPIENAHAWECYLRARQEIARSTEDALDRALHHLHNGLRIVGENALLYAGLGYTHWAFVNAGIKPEEHIREMEDYTQKVLALDPESPHGYFLLGITQQAIQGALQESAHNLKRALLMDVNNPDVLFWLCLLYGFAGKIESANPLADRLLRIDPLNPMNQGLPGFLLTLEGRFEEALVPLKLMYEMDTGNPGLPFLYAHGLASNQQTQLACSILDQLVDEHAEHPFGRIGRFWKHALRGDREGALDAATPVLRVIAEQDMQYAWFMAQGHALIDDQDMAVNWLERAASRGFNNYPLFSQLDPFLKSLHGHAGFEQLMLRVKEKWTDFKV